MEVRRGTARDAFDRHAEVYDERFSNLKLTRQIRSDIWRVADAIFPSGARVLDAGCGTGEDTIHFAQTGCIVTGIDISPAMVEKANAKAAGLGLTGRARCRVQDIEHFNPEPHSFDGIFSNFGVLNCISDLDWLRPIAERTLKPGGHVVLVTMGRFYPLESLIFLLKGHPLQALRRFKRPAQAIVEGVRMNVFYHSPASIARCLGAEFELIRIAGLHSLLPGPGLDHLEKFRVFRMMRPLDRFICGLSLTASWADHFISVWQYRE